MKIIDSDLSTN